MIDEETKIVLKQIGESEPGKILKKYIESEIKIMEGTIDDYKDWPDVEGRRRAKPILKKILYFLEPKQIESKGKNQYE